MKMDLEVISESGVWLNSTFSAFTYLNDDVNHDVAVLWQQSKQNIYIVLALAVCDKFSPVVCEF